MKPCLSYRSLSLALAFLASTPIVQAGAWKGPGESFWTTNNWSGNRPDVNNEAAFVGYGTLPAFSSVFVGSRNGVTPPADRRIRSLVADNGTYLLDFKPYGGTAYGSLNVVGGYSLPGYSGNANVGVLAYGGVDRNTLLAFLDADMKVAGQLGVYSGSIAGGRNASLYFDGNSGRRAWNAEATGLQLAAVNGTSTFLVTNSARVSLSGAIEASGFGTNTLNIQNGGFLKSDTIRVQAPTRLNINLSEGSLSTGDLVYSGAAGALNINSRGTLEAKSLSLISGTDTLGLNANLSGVAQLTPTSQTLADGTVVWNGGKLMIDGASSTFVAPRLNVSGGSLTAFEAYLGAGSFEVTSGGVVQFAPRTAGSPGSGFEEGGELFTRTKLAVNGVNSILQARYIEQESGLITVGSNSLIEPVASPIGGDQAGLFMTLKGTTSVQGTIDLSRDDVRRGSLSLYGVLELDGGTLRDGFLDFYSGSRFTQNGARLINIEIGRSSLASALASYEVKGQGLIADSSLRLPELIVSNGRVVNTIANLERFTLGADGIVEGGSLHARDPITLAAGTTRGAQISSEGTLTLTGGTHMDPSFFGFEGLTVSGGIVTGGSLGGTLTINGGTVDGTRIGGGSRVTIDSATVTKATAGYSIPQIQVRNGGKLEYVSKSHFAQDGIKVTGGSRFSIGSVGISQEDALVEGGSVFESESVGLGILYEKANGGSSVLRTSFTGADMSVSGVGSHLRVTSPFGEGHLVPTIALNFHTLGLTDGGSADVGRSAAEMVANTLTVGDQGQLVGWGKVEGSVVVRDGGLVDIGFSPGILTVADSLTMTGGFLRMEIGKTSDLLRANKISLLGGTLELLASADYDPSAFTEVGLFETPSFLFSGARVTYGAGLENIRFDPRTGRVQTVPEPIALVSLTVGALALLRRRRRA